MKKVMGTNLATARGQDTFLLYFSGFVCHPDFDPRLALEDSTKRTSDRMSFFVLYEREETMPDGQMGTRGLLRNSSVSHLPA